MFVDTNVLLDVLAQREPFYRASATVSTQIEEYRLEGFISAISFNNIHYILRKRAGAAKALQAMRALMDTFTTVELDERTIRRAVDSGMDDFEDAIQYFSALRCSADYLLTRDVGGFPHQDIPVLSPEEFLRLDLGFGIPAQKQPHIPKRQEQAAADPDKR